MNLRLCSSLCLVLFLFGGVAAGRAQEDKPEQQPVGGLAFLDEVEVTVVNIEVFVRDKEGRPVTGLTVDDFEVFQDGQLRELTNFLFVDEGYRPTEQGLPAATPLPAAEGPEEPEAGGLPAEAPPEIKPIHLVVYIDNENQRPFDRNRVLGHLRRFLDDTVRPGVEAMIVAYQGSAKIVQPFTSDRRELAEALRSVRTNTGGRIKRLEQC